MTPRHASDSPGASGTTAAFQGGPDGARALAIYLALTVVMTWPLVGHLSDHLPLGNNDLWQNYWNFNHWKESLLGPLTSPYRTSSIYQPGDVSLAFHTHSPANMLTMLPVAVLLGEAAALNIAIFLGFALSAWGLFLLARELTGSPRAALLAGVLFGFLPQHYEQSLEHLNLASYQGMPFFLLFLIRTLHNGGTRNAILCGVFFAWNALYAWHNGVMATVLGTLVAVHALVKIRPTRSRVTVLRELTLAALVTTVICLPFLWPLLRDWWAGLNPIKAPVAKGIDPLFLAIPSANHPLWGSAVAPFYEDWKTYASVGFTCYVGLSALTIVVLARLRSRATPSARPTDRRPGESPRLWCALAVLFFVLACGTELTLAGVERFTHMPFELWAGTPILETLRVANRLVIPGALAFSIVVAFSIRTLLEQATERPLFGLDPRRLQLCIAALLVVDLLGVPYPLRPLPKPDWIETLADAPQGLLLNVPGGHRARGAKDLYLQTLHGRPIVGGYTSVPPAFMEERTRSLPWLSHIFVTRPRGNVDPTEGFREVLHALPIRVVVVHLGRQREALSALLREHAGTPKARLYNPARSMPSAELERFRGGIQEVCGPPRYADAEVEIYVTP